MRPFTLALTGTLAAMLAGCTTPQNKFGTADADHTGGISPAEFDAYMKEAVFEQIDQDKDGVITMEEWKAANPSGSADVFKRADADGDGRITREEGDAAFDRKGNLPKLFKKIDTDGDGSISPAEAQDFKASVWAQPGFTKLERLSQSAN